MVQLSLHEDFALPWHPSRGVGIGEKPSMCFAWRWTADKFEFYGEFAGQLFLKMEAITKPLRKSQDKNSPESHLLVVKSTFISRSSSLAKVVKEGEGEGTT